MGVEHKINNQFKIIDLEKLSASIKNANIHLKEEKILDRSKQIIKDAFEEEWRKRRPFVILNSDYKSNKACWGPKEFLRISQQINTPKVIDCQSRRTCALSTGDHNRLQIGDEYTFLVLT